MQVKYDRVSVKQAWARGILYRLYKTLPSSGEFLKMLVYQPDPWWVNGTVRGGKYQMDRLHWPQLPTKSLPKGNTCTNGTLAACYLETVPIEVAGTKQSWKESIFSWPCWHQTHEHSSTHELSSLPTITVKHQRFLNFISESMPSQNPTV